MRAVYTACVLVWCVIVYCTRCVRCCLPVLLPMRFALLCTLVVGAVCDTVCDVACAVHCVAVRVVCAPCGAVYGCARFVFTLLCIYLALSVSHTQLALSAVTLPPRLHCV